MLQSRTVSLLNESTVWVDSCSIFFGLLFSQSEDVLQTVQRHLHDFWVHHRQQVTHGFDGIQRHQIPVHMKRNVNSINWFQTFSFKLETQPVSFQNISDRQIKLCLDCQCSELSELHCYKPWECSSLFRGDLLICQCTLTSWRTTVFKSTNAPYLCRSAPWGGVSDSPRCLLPRTELSLLKDLNKYWEDVGIDHILQWGNIVSYTDTEQQPSSEWHTTPSWSSFTWIWARFPAVMLDTVQHASFLMDSLGLLRRWSKHGSAAQFKITWDDKHPSRSQMAPFTFYTVHGKWVNTWSASTWVWMSSPVTMLPTARKAGETTL